MNIFHHMNKLFYFYGFESDTNGRAIQRCLMVTTTLVLVLDALFWIIIFFLDSREVFHMSWVIKMVIRIISFSLYTIRHKRLIDFSKQINADSIDKNLCRVSLILFMTWCGAVMCMVPSIIRWTNDESRKDYLGLFNYRLNLTIFSIINLIGVVYGFGIGIMQLLVYFQTHYIIYRIKVNHYNNLTKKSAHRDLLRIRYLRLEEIRIRELEQNFNQLLGFIPALWMAELFIRLCLGITNIVIYPVSVDEIVLYFFDTIIFHSILLIIIIFVGYFDNKFDTNSVIAIISKAFAPKPSHDLTFELEMIKYLSELSSRSQNPIKSVGLFTINGTFILISANAVISFSVMFIQLIQGWPKSGESHNNSQI